MRFTAAKIPLSLFSEGLMTIFWMPDTLLRKHIEVLTLNNLIILMRMFLKINLEHTIMSVCTDNKQYTLFTFWDISWKQHITSKQRVHAQEESPVHPGRSIGLMAPELHLSFLPAMWFWWLHQAADFNSCWSGWQPNVKRLRWESAPSNLRWWSSVGKGWGDLSRSGMRTCPQVEELNQVGVFTSEGRMEREIYRWIGAELNEEDLDYWLSLVPTLTYGHDLWVETERTRSRFQVA